MRLVHLTYLPNQAPLVYPTSGPPATLIIVIIIVLMNNININNKNKNNKKYNRK